MTTSAPKRPSKNEEKETHPAARMGELLESLRKDELLEGRKDEFLELLDSMMRDMQWRFDEFHELHRTFKRAIDAQEKNVAATFDAALNEARTRGVQRATEILAAPGMLSADAFAKIIGLSREAVRLKRKRHEVLGLEGAKRGARFPQWQITTDGGLLPGLPNLFERLGGNSWTVYRFLIQRHPELDGATAADALKAGKVDRVLAAAENAGRAFS